MNADIVANTVDVTAALHHTYLQRGDVRSQKRAHCDSDTDANLTASINVHFTHSSLDVTHSSDVHMWPSDISPGNRFNFLDFYKLETLPGKLLVC